MTCLVMFLDKITGQHFIGFFDLEKGEGEENYGRGMEG